MIRFLLKTGCFVLAVLLGLAAVSYPMQPKAGDEGTIEGSIPKDLLLANTGNSHGMFAMDYSVFPASVPTYNFAMESQSVVYDEKLIRYFEHHFAAQDAVLFVFVDLVSLWYEETNEADFQAKNDRYFPILGAKNMRFRTTFETILHRYFYAMTCMDRWTQTLFQIEDQGAESNPQLTRYSREEIGRMRAAHHLAHILAADGAVLPQNETNIAALECLLAFCKENGIRPILLTNPYHRSYTKNIPEVVTEAVTARVEALAEAYDVPWWNYYDAEPIHGDERYFTDTDHLSEEGRELFTEMLKQRLLEEGYFSKEQLGA